ncbi:hypothetical protein OEA41_003282 [Lepraria neglecta]|uniref:MHYT domain-containing protein n=1 Tax=Lepraria neglecta TaxID=209136 RepID=A0AAD9Z5Q3_9LECA|nr:hypothetical protein OEA41_003282 [Lepraria neglecta]
MDPSQWIGQVINHSHKPGWIVLVYFISVTGCWTTLELLHRRTSARGYYNWYLLLAAAVVMGGVGVWCMHFIRNLAIEMDKGQPDLQIQYSAGFTVGSFLLPIFVLAIAFYFFSTSESVSMLGLKIGGVLTGMAVWNALYDLSAAT